MSTQIIDSEDSIESIENHFKIEAGPGAGKTHWLIKHIKRVLNESTRLGKSKKIACITYTNVGVETITKRLGDSIEQVEVSTIHSFLYKHVIKPYIFLLKDEVNIPIEKIDGHDELLPSPGLIQKWKKETQQFYLDDDKKIYDALISIRWMLNNDKDDVELKQNEIWKGKIGNYNIKKSSYIDYKKLFWERGMLHHDDVLGFSIKIIKRNPDIIRVLRSKFPYIFIDEFQDTNPIQTYIIKVLSNEETIVGVIGDQAQSIYSFQGADVSQFVNYNVENLKKYKIEHNNRSTEQIIEVLNKIRTDIKQNSPRKLIGKKPIIIVGNRLDAKNKAKELCGNEDVYTLSYSNISSNEMRNDTISTVDDDLLLELRKAGNNDKRTKIIIACITSLELAKQKRFKDAIKELSRIYSYIDPAYKGQKIALRILKKLMNNYNKIHSQNIFQLYEFLKKIEETGLNKEAVITTGKLKDFCEKTVYNQVALWVKIIDDETLDRTIHKAKGAEFKNVIVIVKSKEGLDFNEEQDIDFLIRPDINKETNRVYYVAMSRAKKMLFVNVPSLKTESEQKLKGIGFDIIRL